VRKTEAAILHRQYTCTG